MSMTSTIMGSGIYDGPLDGFKIGLIVVITVLLTLLLATGGK